MADIKVNLEDVRSGILHEIESAARGAATERVFALSEALRGVEADLRNLLLIEERLDGYQVAIKGVNVPRREQEATLDAPPSTDGRQPQTAVVPSDSPITPEVLGSAEEAIGKMVQEGKVEVGYAEKLLDQLGNRIARRSPRQRGKEIRETLARERHLAPEKGAIYRTPSGSLVGIATASETKPNSWFLGLPDTPLKVVALVCQRKDSRLDFILPPYVVTRIWPQLSRSGDQVKFNIVARGSHYQLQVPGQPPLDITGFNGGYGPLI